jgi:protein TonB
MAFEQFLNQKQDRKDRSKWRVVTYALSLTLHAAVLVALLVRSFWYVEELEPKGVVITMAMRLPPPPPPPAPAARKDPERPRTAAVVRPRRDKLVQPVEPKPEQVAKAEEPSEAPADTGDVGGVPGGVEGGVAGGVETTAAAPPPPPKAKPVEMAPIMLPPSIGTGQRLSDLNDPRFRPTLPPALNRAGMVIWGLFRICVATNGHVKEVKVLKSADALVDQTWSDIIGRWEYRPYSIEGRPIPFCHAARIEVRAQL